MGQYYKAVNLTKKEVLTPHAFGDGAKLMEFGNSYCGMMTALAVLLADGNNRGGGDLYSDNPVIGSWAGDKIVIAGDYADLGKFAGRFRNKTLYAVAEDFTDISSKVMKAMLDDEWVASKVQDRVDESWEGSSLRKTYAAAKAGR